MQTKFVRMWEKVLLVLLGVELVGWLADGIIWQFWMPVEWFRLFGELLLAWGIVPILAFAFSLAKKNM